MTITLKTGEKAQLDERDYNELVKYGWSLSASGYASRVVWVDGKTKNIFMHRLVNGTPSGKYTDHINGDKLDNRRNNLRTASRSQNRLNYKKPDKGNSTGYRGVSRCNRNKFRSALFYDGWKISLGYYDDLETAALIRFAAEQQIPKYSIIV